MLVRATARTLSNLRTGSTATLLTSMIVREDSMTLYGFAEPAEREVFEMMLSVSGIGPRIALAVLSVHTATEVERAVATGDDKAFTKVPGIGPKSARRIVLELAGKLILSEGQAEEKRSRPGHRVEAPGYGCAHLFRVERKRRRCRNRRLCAA